MLRHSRIAVVIPAFNEAERIQATLASVPWYVDCVIVVDDRSSDATAALARQRQRSDPRIAVVSHQQNRGVGAAILTGYQAARERRCDIAVVMAGDGQMHPEDMPNLLLPILLGDADYVKGDRLGWPGAHQLIPKRRLLGIWLLGPLTRWSTGLRGLRDFQCGYTALRLSILDAVRVAAVWPGYGFPNDFLNHLILAGARVVQRVVRPIYAGERSDLKIRAVVLPLLRLLARGTARRWLLGVPDSSAVRSTGTKTSPAQTQPTAVALSAVEP